MGCKAVQWGSPGITSYLLCGTSPLCRLHEHKVDSGREKNWKRESFPPQYYHMGIIFNFNVYTPHKYWAKISIHVTSAGLKVEAQLRMFSCNIVCIYLLAAVLHSYIFFQSILRYVNIGLLCNSALFFPRQTHVYISNINARTLAFYANGMLRGCCSFYCVTPMFCGCKWAFMLQKHLTHLRGEHVWLGERVAWE